jgi:hypothetical protein
VIPTVLTHEQLTTFARDGYVVVPGVIPEPLLGAADAEIDRRVAADPPPADARGPHFVFEPAERLPAADAALRESGALALADTLVAPLHLRHAVGYGIIQIALNIPPFIHWPGSPHLDGYRGDEQPRPFTLLAAIFLTDEAEPNHGNLWVWPGSHLAHARLFRERGVDALLGPAGGHTGLVQPPFPLGAPRPVLARRGDLLLAHYLLGHNTGGNASEQVRRTLYYRLSGERTADRWQEVMLDPFAEYASLRALVEG